MVVFVIRLADLELLSQDGLGGGLSTSEIIEKIRHQFDYLPGELAIEIKDGVATIRFEEAFEGERSEARRLSEKAAKRASSGEFQKAKDIYARVLELDPTMADARRELATRALAPDIKKLERQGYCGDSIAKVILDLAGGLCGCLFNTPLGLLIESRLHRGTRRVSAASQLKGSEIQQRGREFLGISTFFCNPFC